MRYDLPPDLVGAARGAGSGADSSRNGSRCGFWAGNMEITIATAQPEFDAWQWVPVARLPELIVSFKRKLYFDLLREFSGLAEPQNQAGDAVRPVV